MQKSGPIIVIDDDEEDRELLQSIFNDLALPNEIVLFSTAEETLKYVRQPKVAPFLILSDINMALMTGFEMRQIIRNDPDLDIKCIPFIFFTTGASRQFVEKAYSLSVQGIFQKPPQYDQWALIIKKIIEYWSDCISPNHF